MTSFKDTAEFIRWNEEMARKYDSESYHLRSSFLIRWIERRRVRAVLDFLDVGPEDCVLEVGCGTGVVLAQVPAGEVWGVDLSGFVLQKSRRRLTGRRATLLQANAERLPLASGSFEKMFCTEVIEHVMEPREVARELARVAGADGMVVISIPNEGLIERLKGVIGRLGLYRWLLQGQKEEQAYDSPAQGNEWHLHQFDMGLLRKVAAGVLEIESVRAIPLWFLPLRYVVRCRAVRVRE